MKLHELSVKRPVCVSMIVLIFVIIGGYALTMLPMELMPEMDMPMAIVMTNYNNVGAREVESMVTETIESACASVSGIDTITSQTMEGRSLMMLQFLYLYQLIELLFFQRFYYDSLCNSFSIPNHIYTHLPEF